MIEEQEGLEIKLTQHCTSKQEAKESLEKAFGSSKDISETEEGIEVGGLWIYAFDEQQQNLELLWRFRNPSAQRNIVRTYQMLKGYGYAGILGKINITCIKNTHHYDNLAAKANLCRQYGLKLGDLRPTWFRADLTLKRLRHVLGDKFGKQLYL